VRTTSTDDTKGKLTRVDVRTNRMKHGVFDVFREGLLSTAELSLSPSSRAVVVASARRVVVLRNDRVMPAECLRVGQESLSQLLPFREDTILSGFV